MDKTKEDSVQSHTGVPGEQSKSEEPEGSIQEGGNPAEAKNDGQGVGSQVSIDSSNPNAVKPNTSQEETLPSTSNVADTDTGTTADSSSLPSQEPDKIRSTTSGDGVNAVDNAGSSGTSQEQNQEIIANTGSNTRIDNNISKESQEIIEEGRTEVGTPKSSSSNSGSPSAGTAGDDNTRRAPPPPSLKPIRTIPQVNGIIRSMAVGFDNVLFTGSDRMVCKWCKGQEVSNFVSPKGTVNAIVLKHSWHHSEPWVFSAHDMGEIGLWVSMERDGLFTQHETLQAFRDSISGLFPWTEPRHNAISCLCLSDDYKFIYSGSASGILNVWSAARFKLVCTIHGHKSPINSLAVGHKAVFSGSSDGTIKLWKRKEDGNKKDLVKHLLIRTFCAQNSTVPVAVNSIVFSTVDNVTGFLYAGSSDGNVRYWKNVSVDEPKADEHKADEDKAAEQKANKHKHAIMSCHTGAVNCLASCSGPFVFSGSTDKTICVWRREDETANHTIAMVLRGHTDVIKCIAVQNDWAVDNATGPRQWIRYSGSLDNTLRMWRVYEQPQAIMEKEKED